MPILAVFKGQDTRLSQYVDSQFCKRKICSFAKDSGIFITGWLDYRP